MSIRSDDPTILPPRPGWGTAGQAIKLRANFYPIKVPARDIYEYDMAVEPDPKARRVRKRIFQLMEDAPAYAPVKPHVVHDWSAIMYSAKPINNNKEPLVVELVYRDEDEDKPSKNAKTFRVTIKWTKTMNTTDLQSYVASESNHDIQPLLSALNVIISNYPSRTGVMVGGSDGKKTNRANKFFFPQQVTSMSGGLEAWKGFYTSVRPIYKSIAVNVNVATTAFYTPMNLLAAMEQARGVINPKRFTSYYFGIRVSTSHLKYKGRKTIRRVMDQGADKQTFILGEGANAKKVTVQQYFQQTYNVRLRQPRANVVDVGSAGRPNYLPPELCEILPDQVFRGKLADEHTAEMIKVAARPPNQNADLIQNAGLSSLGFNQTQGLLQQFNLNIGNEMTVVPGRILPPPQILYGGNKMMRADNASWNLRDIKFQLGAKLEKWAVICLNDEGKDDFTDQRHLGDLMEGFTNMLKSLGMAVPDKPILKRCDLPRKTHLDSNRSEAIGAILSVIKTLPGKPKLLLFILSNSDKNIYNGIKYLCDVQMDIHCVCVQAGKIRRVPGQPQYFANVALKFNAKLGGINHGLHQDNLRWLNQKPTMVVGMDVTHPGPGATKGAPSIAAIVASTDSRFAQYPASLRVQASKKEMITELAAMMVERLNAFRQATRRLPERILVFRDGVSEGQYEQVVEIEFPALLQGCREVDPKFRPKVTIAICGKRHHTRFYPTTEADADRTSNTKAGTVVDKGVTTVYNFDFYLQAHAGLQGSVRPTHYVVVVDENKFGADEIQKLTHDTSYMFARATKGVSLVSPAYYADIACERGRCYLHDALSSSDDAATTDNEEQVYKKAVDRWSKGPTGPVIKNSMFYL